MRRRIIDSYRFLTKAARAVERLGQPYREKEMGGR
jgi:hypothetical protein